MQDVRMELMDVLPKQSNISAIGFLILSNLGHTHLLPETWHNPAESGTKEAIAKQFADWYFHGKTVQFIPDCPHLYGCI
ncbi:unnamed protein product [Cuscuta campestris]|uniref:Uncharacterized protein n=1 Tax=Cuscuta campestris TaxID=132261 RepID=A0A484K0K4_9ASTE|nr:unnamed protein product [Cuscuta campestris]